MKHVGGDTVLHRTREVLYTALGSEGVMMDLDAGNYYGLNRVGARVWELLEQPRTVAEVASSLEEEYAVDHAESLEAVTAFVAALMEHGLVVCAEGRGRGV